MDLVLTGASRGIGAALTLALSRRDDLRLFLVARDEERLTALAKTCRAARVFTADLSNVHDAAALGAKLAGDVHPGATLIHNAGVWPTRRELTSEGWERSYAVNHLAPLALQAPLLEKGVLSRVMVVGAGLMVRGRFDPRRTPTGDDFSSFRTYCTTKRCFAEATRALAPKYPQVDFLVLHPGVVNTDLGSRSGLLGWLLSRFKRRWETPETCAARLSRILDLPKWSQPGEAAWYFEEQAKPWPD